MVLLLGFLALAVRLMFVVLQPARLLNDSADYERLAVLIVHGHGFGVSHFTPAGGPTALRPPLYPLALAAVYSLTGVHVVAARLAGAVLGAGLVSLIVMVSTLLWGRRHAAVIGVLAAIYPPLVIASTALMSEAVALPLELLVLLCTLMYRRSHRAGWLVAGGAAFGLAVLARPSLIVGAASLILLMWRGDVRRWGRTVAVAGGACLLVVLPWLIRDRVAFHAWVPLTTQDGYVLAGTYNSTSMSDPRYPAAWRPANLDPQISRLIRDHPNANEYEMDKLLNAAVIRFVGRHPADVGKAFVYNSARLFDLGGYDYTREAELSEYGYPMVYGTVDMLSLAVLAPFAAIGIWSEGRERRNLSYWAWPVLLSLSMAVVEVLPRYRAVLALYRASGRTGGMRRLQWVDQSPAG